MNLYFLKFCDFLLSFVFWFLCVAFLITASADLFLKTAKFQISESAYFGGSAHHNTGYPISVEFDLKTNNSIVKRNDKVTRDIKRQLTIETENSSEIIEEKGFEKITTVIYAQPNHGSIHILSGIRFYLIIILLILIFWFSRQFLKTLITKINFHSRINQILKYLGLLMISYFLISVLLNFLIGIQIKYFNLETIENGITIPTSSITLNPSIDFPWIFLIIGCALLGMRNLLDLGLRLQQENDLTI